MQLNLDKAWKAYQEAEIPHKRDAQRWWLEATKIANNEPLQKLNDGIEGDEVPDIYLEYIVIAIDRSTNDRIVFWRPAARGYTTNPFWAGRFTEKFVQNNPNCNDGRNAIAVRLTTANMRRMQFSCSFDMVAFNIYFNPNCNGDGQESEA